jgi:GR25 family glycosyltransferase involved in LPS biosynthesis
MTIKFYIGYYPEFRASGENFAGTEWALRNLAEAFASLGHAVFITGEIVQENALNGVIYTKDYNVHSDILIALNYTHYIDLISEDSYDKSYFWIHNTDPFFYNYYKGENVPSLQDRVFSHPKFKSVICVSKYHKEEFEKRFFGVPSIMLYNAVKRIDVSRINKSRIKDSYIYVSHAERGLEEILTHWRQILYHRPESSLYIVTPKYGEGYYEKHFSHVTSTYKNVYYHGSMSKDDLISFAGSKHYWLYPSNYDETFCVAAVEMQMLGLIPITRFRAALKETVFHCIEFDSWLSCISSNSQFKILPNGNTLKYNITDFFDPIKIAKEFLNINVMENKLKIDAVYVITFDVSDEAINRYTTEFNKLGIIPGQFHLFKAVDGRNPKVDFDWSLYKNWKIDNHSNSYYNRDILPGEIGCALSHVSIWKDAKKKNYDSILILEDDFKVDEEFPAEKIELDDWGLLYLGRQKLGEDSDISNPLNVPPPGYSQYLNRDKQNSAENYEILNSIYTSPGYSWLSHAYMLSKLGIERILEQNFEKYILPVDDFIASTYSNNNERTDLTFIWKDMNAYSLKECIVSQTSNSKTSKTSSNSFASNIYLTKDVDKWSSMYINPALKNKEYDLIVDEPIPDVLHLHAFKKEFCNEVIRLAEECGKWTKDRHYYYPTHDMLINEFQLHDAYDMFLNTYIYPLVKSNFVLTGDKWKKFSSENFIIKYTPENQGHLSLHHDDSAFSTVLTLNDEYEGGGTWFSKQKKLVKGEVGELTIHPGQITHRHGARPVTSGVRYVLVSFIRQVY